MPVDRRDMQAALAGKLNCARENRDHIWYFFTHEGHRVTATKVSHSGKQIHDGLVSAMARQLKMRKKTLLGIVDCSKGLDEYLEELRQRGLIN